MRRLVSSRLVWIYNVCTLAVISACRVERIKSLVCTRPHTDLQTIKYCCSISADHVHWISDSDTVRAPAVWPWRLAGRDCPIACAPVSQRRDTQRTYGDNCRSTWRRQQLLQVAKLYLVLYFFFQQTIFRASSLHSLVYPTCTYIYIVLTTFTIWKWHVGHLS